MLIDSEHGAVEKATRELWHLLLMLLVKHLLQDIPVRKLLDEPVSVASIKVEVCFKGINHLRH